MLGMVTPPILRIMLMRLPIIPCLARKINTFFNIFLVKHKFFQPLTRMGKMIIA